MFNQLNTIVDRLKPFAGMELKGDISLQQVKLLASAAGLSSDANLLTKLVTVITEVSVDLRKSPEKLTVGKVIAHPKLVGFLNELPKGPDYKTVKCPQCKRVLERDITNPTPCHICGFEWNRG